MKRKEKYDNNRGAALISVMIAVTFITIVASALLYMSYMNFSMKTMSVKSKANFYETEGYLQGVTVKLQDEIAKSPNPETTISTIMSNSGDYNCSKLLQLKYPTATGDADSASINIDGDIVTLKKGSTYIAPSTVSSKTTKYTFNDVTILQETSEGLTNNIKTDIVYYVTKETTNAKAGGIGEFSMLMDGSLASSGGKFDSMTLYGNNFISNAVYRSDLGRTIPGGNAIVLDNCAKITIAGEYCVVYGDIHLYNSSSLIITSGNLCVYGDIYLHDNSTLICAGNVYMVTEALGDLYGRTAPTSIKCDDGQLAKHVYPSGLSVQSIPKANFDRVVQILHYDVNDEKDDGLVHQIINQDGAPIYKRSGDYAGASFLMGADGKPIPTGDYIKYTDLNNEFYKSASVSGRTMGWGSTGCKTSFNAGDFDNRLSFLIKDGAVIKETCYNSTIISPYPIVYSEAHGIQLSKIGEDMFNYLSVKYWDNTNPMWNSSLFYNIDYSVNGNNYHGYPLSCGDFFVDECNDIVNEILTKSSNGGGGGTPIIISSMTFENWVKDSE